MQTIVNTADGADALWLNQLYSIASGGDFWQSGGAISSGGSSTSIRLSVASVTVNIGGESVTHGSQPVTHSPTGGEHRTDVIYADATGVHVQEGVEMPKLPQENTFPSIWQPTPDNGSLVGGVPLWCVHITPGDAASGDIDSWQTQNRRMNAENIDTDAVVELLEGYDTSANSPIQTTVENATALDGQDAGAGVFGALSPTVLRDTLADGEFGEEMTVRVPDGYEMQLFAWEAATRERITGAPARLQLLSIANDGSLNTIANAQGYEPRSETGLTKGPGSYVYRLRNLNGGTTLNMTGLIWWALRPAGSG